MPNVTQLAQQIPSSPTIALNDKAKQLKAQGVDVVGLAGGDPDFDTPTHIIEAGVNAIQSGKTHYAAPSKGITPLTEAISNKMEKDNKVKINPSTDVVVTPGGKLSIYLAFKSILDPGDEVLVLAPYWVSYPSIITMVGGVPVTVTLSSEDNYTVHLEQLRQAITSKTKAIIVNSPNNPCGRMMTQEEADAIATVATESDLFVVADEMYEKLNFDDRQHISLASNPDLKDRTLTINGMSKAYAMTGWRLGWVAGPEYVMKVVAKFNSQTATAAATFTMHAAVAALTGLQDEVVMMRSAYQERRDFLVKSFNSIEKMSCKPIEGAFYAFPQFHTDKSSNEIADLILDKAKVVGVPGSAFGITDTVHMRFSFATDMESLEKAMDRLHEIAHLF